jgi:methylated-DNA-[protein]-cysteine S-methyltransferase
MRKGLLEIPFGEVRTYGELARRLATSPRAMGQALGANPLPILIPCHRVIAADGLGGFACGLEWKRKLLKFERRL